MKVNAQTKIFPILPEAEINLEKICIEKLHQMYGKAILQIAPWTGQFCGAKRTRSGASGHLNFMILKPHSYTDNNHQ